MTVLVRPQSRQLGAHLRILRRSNIRGFLLAGLVDGLDLRLLIRRQRNGLVDRGNSILSAHLPATATAAGTRPPSTWATRGAVTFRSAARNTSSTTIGTFRTTGRTVTSSSATRTTRSTAATRISIHARTLTTRASIRPRASSAALVLWRVRCLQHGCNSLIYVEAFGKSRSSEVAQLNNRIAPGPVHTLLHRQLRRSRVGFRRENCLKVNQLH